MKFIVTFIYIKETKLERNQMQAFVKKNTKIELFRLNERVIEEARSKLRKTEQVKHRVFIN